MVALKLYFFIILLCAGAGAGANYFSEVKPKTQSLMGGLDQLQDMGENLSTDQKEKLKEQYGNMDLKGADMKDLMEKYKQMQGK